MSLSGRSCLLLCPFNRKQLYLASRLPHASTCIYLTNAAITANHNLLCKPQTLIFCVSRQKMTSLLPQFLSTYHDLAFSFETVCKIDAGCCAKFAIIPSLVFELLQDEGRRPFRLPQTRRDLNRLLAGSYASLLRRSHQSRPMANHPLQPHLLSPAHGPMISLQRRPTSRVEPDWGAAGRARSRPEKAD